MLPVVRRPLVTATEDLDVTVVGLDLTAMVDLDVTAMEDLDVVVMDHAVTVMGLDVTVVGLGAITTTVLAVLTEIVKKLAFQKAVGVAVNRREVGTSMLLIVEEIRPSANHPRVYPIRLLVLGNSVATSPLLLYGKCFFMFQHHHLHCRLS